MAFDQKRRDKQGITYRFFVLQQFQKQFQLLRRHPVHQRLCVRVLWVADISFGRVDVLVVLAQTTDDMRD